MVERTSWTITKGMSKAVDTLRIRYMNRTKKTISKSAFLGKMILMCNNHLDALENAIAGPVLREFIEGNLDEEVKEVKN